MCFVLLFFFFFFFFFFLQIGHILRLHFCIYAYKPKPLSEERVYAERIIMFFQWRKFFSLRVGPSIERAKAVLTELHFLNMSTFSSRLACWIQISADIILNYFFLICPRKYALAFHANCLLRRQFARNVKLSPTICMKDQFLGENTTISATDES